MTLNLDAIDRRISAIASASGSAQLLLQDAIAMLAEIRRLRAALEYYADPGNWAEQENWIGPVGYQVCTSRVECIDDAGDRARAALETK